MGLEMPMSTKHEIPANDPGHHTRTIKGMLDNVIQHLRDDVSKIDEPRAQAMFETTAEALSGLKTAFEH
jgi:hypothetical protein